MQDQLNQLREEALAALAEVPSLELLDEVRRQYLGKKGALTALLRGMGQVPAGERPALGKLANETREAVEAALESRKEALSVTSVAAGLAAEAIDVTMPGRAQRPGRGHPLVQVEQRICEIFAGMGFEVVEGPEVETEWYNFVALNIPEAHPARDDHESFYITDDILLRTETSAVQIRTMEKREPPIRVIAPGRVYRRDAVDRTHSHTFHQVEGLLVDEGVRFGDLKGVLTIFARRMFGDEVVSRFRPHYFPFTEPSAEVDIQCANCRGSGCAVCGQSGWLEVLGSGMVHPQVLENVGYDTSRYNGFAFGMGIERLAMLKYGIDDIRLFYENDRRFLDQF
jgi:phenylalanyl-tRNA synthetase alpha chain